MSKRDVFRDYGPGEPGTPGAGPGAGKSPDSETWRQVCQAVACGAAAAVSRAAPRAADGGKRTVGVTIAIESMGVFRFIEGDSGRDERSLAEAMVNVFTALVRSIDAIRASQIVAVARTHHDGSRDALLALALMISLGSAVQQAEHFCRDIEELEPDFRRVVAGMLERGRELVIEALPDGVFEAFEERYTQGGEHDA